jgi:hypothetical protein
MQFSLRSLVIATAVLPAAVGYVAMSFHRRYDGRIEFLWPDPIITFCFAGWVLLWLYLGKRPLSAPN